MSILIKGMEMPKCCEVCKFCYADAENFCKVTYNYIPLTEGRPKDCPLVEVPEPHGRLIEAPEIKWQKDSGEVSVGALIAIAQKIDDAPTVIEAEEQDHD